MEGRGSADSGVTTLGPLTGFEEGGHYEKADTARGSAMTERELSGRGEKTVEVEELRELLEQDTLFPASAGPDLEAGANRCAAS